MDRFIERGGPMRKRLLLGGILLAGVAAAGCATAPPVTGPSTRDSAPAAEYGYRKAGAGGADRFEGTEEAGGRREVPGQERLRPRPPGERDPGHPHHRARALRPVHHGDAAGPRPASRRAGPGQERDDQGGDGGEVRRGAGGQRDRDRRRFPVRRQAEVGHLSPGGEQDPDGGGDRGRAGGRRHHREDHLRGERDRRPRDFLHRGAGDRRHGPATTRRWRGRRSARRCRSSSTT